MRCIWLKESHVLGQDDSVWIPHNGDLPGSVLCCGQMGTFFGVVKSLNLHTVPRLGGSGCPPVRPPLGCCADSSWTIFSWPLVQGKMLLCPPRAATFPPCRQARACTRPRDISAFSRRWEREAGRSVLKEGAAPPFIATAQYTWRLRGERTEQQREAPRTPGGQTG